MAARKKKTVSKKAASKKATVKAASKKKAPARKTSSSAAASRKVRAGKKASRKTAPGGKARAATGQAAAGEKVPASAASRATAKARKGYSSRDVNLGHIFALRPRAATSFRPDAFRRARQLLEEEEFASPGEAARAVADKALELTREGAPAAPARKGHR